MYLSLTKTFVYVLIFLCFFSNFNVYSSNEKILYSKKNISNYFSGIVSSKNHNNKLALKYLNNLRYLKNSHDQFNRELVFALVQRQKIAQFLLNYIKVFENQSHEYKTVLNFIPNNFKKNFTLINDAFVNCYLDSNKVDSTFLKLINPNTLNFTRYNFFYANFLVSKNRNNEALKVLEKDFDILDTNLLLHQARSWLKKGKTNKIKAVFNCKNPNHLISEFTLTLNLHSTVLC